MIKSVFLSSTFSDFSEERKILTESIPYIKIHVNCAERMGCSQQDLAKTIKEWIDESDMIVLLIGGKYGTFSNNHQSWTRLEFSYAKKKNKPIFAYFRELHNETKLYVDVDIDQKKQDELKRFIEDVEKYASNIPRYDHDKIYLLVAMVIRDLERQQVKLDRKENEDDFNAGF